MERQASSFSHRRTNSTRAKEGSAKASERSIEAETREAIGRLGRLHRWVYWLVTWTLALVLLGFASAVVLEKSTAAKHANASILAYMLGLVLADCVGLIAEFALPRWRVSRPLVLLVLLPVACICYLHHPPEHDDWVFGDAVATAILAIFLGVAALGAAWWHGFQLRRSLAQLSLDLAAGYWLSFHTPESPGLPELKVLPCGFSYLPKAAPRHRLVPFKIDTAH